MSRRPPEPASAEPRRRRRRPSRRPPRSDAADGLRSPRLDIGRGRYVALLADTGITHGLIGPREAPRLWDRHVLNCAVVQPVLRRRARGSRTSGPAPASRASRWPSPAPTSHVAWSSRCCAGPSGSTATIERARPDQRRRSTAAGPSRSWGARRLPSRDRPGGGPHRRAGPDHPPAPRRRWLLQALKGETRSDRARRGCGPAARSGASRWSVSRFGAGIVDPETVRPAWSRSTRWWAQRLRGGASGRGPRRAGRTSVPARAAELGDGRDRCPQRGVAA